MQTKLTLRLEDTLINQAKDEAKKRGVSLSKLVGEYFELFLQKEKVKEESITAQLSGILNADDKDDYKQHWQKKYL